jgi:excisionase family DNA binding protein
MTVEIKFSELDLEAIRGIIREEIERDKKKGKEALYTIDELCAHLGVERSTYHRHVREGRLKVKRVGNKIQLLD